MKYNMYDEWFDNIQAQASNLSWDDAIKACIKITVFDACGFPGPQVNDMRELLKVDWDWQTDKEFMNMLVDEKDEE